MRLLGSRTLIIEVEIDEKGMRKMNFNLRDCIARLKHAIPKWAFLTSNCSVNKGDEYEVVKKNEIKN